MNQPATVITAAGPGLHAASSIAIKPRSTACAFRRPSVDCGTATYYRYLQVIDNITS